jgi:hypothetical protein
MHFEEFGQQLPRGIGQVRPRSALNLRQIALTHRSLKLRPDCPDQLLLRHGTIQAAKIAFDFPQIPELFAELHGCLSWIASSR